MVEYEGGGALRGVVAVVLMTIIALGICLGVAALVTGEWFSAILRLGVAAFIWWYLLRIFGESSNKKEKL